jgi:hypothetical protein
MRDVAPQIVSLTCLCGATGEAPVGARVECECGRTFEAAPPPSHAAALDDLRRRHRVLLAVSLVAVVVACTAPLAVLDRGAAVVVPAAALVVWLAMVRPHLERRHRRRLAALPGWSLPA